MEEAAISGKGPVESVEPSKKKNLSLVPYICFGLIVAIIRGSILYIHFTLPLMMATMGPKHM
jgi:hypothetical protein